MGWSAAKVRHPGNPGQTELRDTSFRVSHPCSRPGAPGSSPVVRPDGMINKAGVLNGRRTTKGDEATRRKGTVTLRELAARGRSARQKRAPRSRLSVLPLAAPAGCRHGVAGQTGQPVCRWGCGRPLQVHSAERALPCRPNVGVVLQGVAPGVVSPHRKRKITPRRPTRYGG